MKFIRKNKWGKLYGMNIEHQHWAMLTKIHRININHIWTQISYSSTDEAHLKNRRVAFVKKEKYAVKSQRQFFKKHRNCPLRTPRKAVYSEHSIAINSISNYWQLSVPSWEASSFCDFWKIASCNFTLFYSFESSKRFFIFQFVLGKEYYSYSAPNAL